MIGCNRPAPPAEPWQQHRSTFEQAWPFGALPNFLSQGCCTDTNPRPSIAALCFADGILLMEAVLLDYVVRRLLAVRIKN